MLPPPPHTSMVVDAQSLGFPMEVPSPDAVDMGSFAGGHVWGSRTQAPGRPGRGGGLPRREERVPPGPWDWPAAILSPPGPAALSQSPWTKARPALGEEERMLPVALWGLALSPCAAATTAFPEGCHEPPGALQAPINYSQVTLNTLSPVWPVAPSWAART